MFRSLVRRGGVVVAACLLMSSTSEATRVEWQLAGQLTNAQNLTIAVINGNLVSQNAQPGDLPLAYTGELVRDSAAQFAQLTLEGAFTSPGRSYSFDIATPNVFDGFEVLDLGAGRVQISDAFAGFDFEIVIAGTGVGQFSFVAPGVIPPSPLEHVWRRRR